MLQLSSVRFPQLLPSSSASLSQSSTTTPACMRNLRTTTDAHSATREEIGRFSRSLALTGYEPNFAGFSNYVNTEHNPIVIHENKPDFRCSDDVTTISGIARGMPNSDALSSSHKATASKVSYLFGHSCSRETGEGHVSSRPSHRETEAELDRKSVATTLFSSQSRGKRDRELNFVHALRDRDNLEKILERKVDLAIQGEKDAQQKMYQGEAEIEAKNWRKSKLDLSFHEFKSRILNVSDFIKSKRGNGQIRLREKVSLSGEFGIEKCALPRESCKRWPRNEKLRRICCEELEQTRKARSEELSLQQRRNSTTVSQMMAQIQDLQNKVNSLSDGREFYDPESGSSSGATHVLDQTSTILSSQNLATLRFWIAAKYTELCGYHWKRS